MYVADSSYVPEMWLPDGNSPFSVFTVFTKRNAHTTSCPFPHLSAGLMAGYNSWRFVSSCPHPTSSGWNGRNPSEGLQCRFTTTPFPSSMVSVVQIHRALLNRFGRLRCFPNTNTYQLNCISSDGSDQTGVGQNGWYGISISELRCADLKCKTTTTTPAGLCWSKRCK